MARPKAIDAPAKAARFRLTLSLRLRAGIVSLVALVVLLLTLLHIQRVAGMAYQSTLYSTRAQVEHVRSMLVHRVAELAADTQAQTIEESARAWSQERAGVLGCVAAAGVEAAAVPRVGKLDAAVRSFVCFRSARSLSEITAPCLRRQDAIVTEQSNCTPLGRDSADSAGVCRNQRMNP